MAGRSTHRGIRANAAGWAAVDARAFSPQPDYSQLVLYVSFLVSPCRERLMTRYIAAMLSFCVCSVCCMPVASVRAQDTLSGMRSSIEPDNPQEKRRRKTSGSRKDLWGDDSREDSSFLGGLITSFLFGADDDDEEEIEYRGLLETPPGRMEAPCETEPRKPEKRGLVGSVIWTVLFMPIAAPGWLLNDEGHYANFSDYPFADDAGNMVITRYRKRNRKLMRARLLTEYGDNFGRQQKISTRVLLDTRSRVGVDASFDYLREQTGGGEHDQMWLGDVNAVYRFAQSEQAEFRAGVGVAWQADSLGSARGVNFTYGGNVYLSKPHMLDFDLDLGSIGEAGLTRFRTGYSLYLHRLHARLGYEYLRVGSFDTNYMSGGVGIDF
ncbi:MAG: hypothetical protein GY924_28025 [Planctomycetaceae bacterium]|nr:hypothetical protein [Planctomycetaceae bacterium]